MIFPAPIGDLSEARNAVLLCQKPEDTVAEFFVVIHEHFDGTGNISCWSWSRRAPT